MNNYFYFIDADYWGNLDRGCPDKSGFSEDADNISNEPCNKLYKYRSYGIEKTINVTWFYCKRNNVCIHGDSRCDLHPHPACLYNVSGQHFSEDEEDCLEEYKQKRLIPASVNFKCSNLDHNENTPAITSTVFDQAKFYDYEESYIPDVLVLPEGTTVFTWATKCNGVVECFGGIDEENCSLSLYGTIGLGKSRKSIKIFN